jgi:acyl-CoA dehydrogenase
MKLYAYRALDYVHAARADDRRYLLYCAVQKAKVSTEGVKVMALLSECIGAKGFESDDTFFEMALRDAQLIPGLESSAHINLGLTAQLMPRYFSRADPNVGEPKSISCGEQESIENAYLMEGRTSAINAIAFPPFLRGYTPLMSIPNVRLFTRQAKAFRLFLRTIHSKRALITQTTLALGQSVATMAYGQLIAENAVRLAVAPEMVSAIFHLLMADLSASALSLASLPELGTVSRLLVRRAVVVPRTSSSDWKWVEEACL